MMIYLRFVLQLIVLILFSTTIQAQMNAKLVYIGDPMCSWCYGFGPQLQKVIETNQDQLDVEFVMGGLRPYYKKPISEMKDFLTHHWEDVHAATQQPFSYGILDREDLNYDTEPPCRAVVIVREMNPSIVASFFLDTQRLFYAENQNMNLAETYHPLLSSHGLNRQEFDKHFASEEMKIKTKVDFTRSQSLGVSSFPTLLMLIDDEVIVLSQGYAKHEAIQQRIEKVLSK